MNSRPYNFKSIDFKSSERWRFTTKEDVAAIVQLCREVPGNIVEVGANTGITSHNLALQFPERIVYAVEYIGRNRTMCPHQMGENPERDVFADCEADPNVVCVSALGHSVPYACFQDIGTIFIDGDHRFDQVKADSERAIMYAKQIIWHDFHPEGVADWMGVRPYLLSLNLELTHIERTSLVYWRL